jgi:hypothetical protein
VHREFHTHSGCPPGIASADRSHPRFSEARRLHGHVLIIDPGIFSFVPRDQFELTALTNKTKNMLYYQHINYDLAG